MANIALFSKMVPDFIRPAATKAATKIGGAFAAVSAGLFSRFPMLTPVMAKLRRFFAPVSKFFKGPFLGFVKKNKKFLIVGGALLTLGGIIAAIFGGRRKEELTVSKNDPDFGAVGEAMKIGDVLRSYQGEIEGTPAAIRTLTTIAANGRNIPELAVCKVCDAIAAEMVLMEAIEPGSLEYIFVQATAFANGQYMDKDYRLENLKTLKRARGLAFCRMSGVTSDVIRRCQDLVFED